MFRIPATVRTAAAALLLLPFVAACGDDPVGPTGPEDVDFAASLGVDLSQMQELPSGVYIQTLQEGVGLPVNNGPMTVAYTLWLPDGTEVDSSNSFEFELGVTSLIDGFVAGVSGMRVDEIRLIVVPSDQGYGSQGTSSVPPNSVLVFEVELLAAGGPV
jgi:peptidylprolyl isomerase